MGAAGLELGRIYQVPFQGLQTAKSVLPSPSKSPESGISPGLPHCWANGASGLLLGITYQVPFDGRHTAMSLFPSPSKSPLIGMSPGAPHCRMYEADPLAGVTYHVWFQGRLTM